jgi:Winged helix DNA-binding domain
MGPVARRIGTEQRRARLALRHNLAAGAGVGGPTEVARDLVALHATSAAAVYLAAWARAREGKAEVRDVERALYEDRTLVRMLGMRRTVFVVPVELAAVVHSAATQALVPGERKRLLQLLEQGGIAGDGDRWLREVQEATMLALAARGEATATELSADVPELRLQIPVFQDKRWGGLIGVSTRVLFLLAAEGRIVRGRPRGSWLSTQYRWAPTETWLRDGMADLTVDAARAELVRRWLWSFGPGTTADLKWWTGWTVAEVKHALAAVGAEEVDLERGTGLVLPGDAEPVPPSDPWVALLPGLDPTVMGWAERGWFLGEHGPALFDRSGNAGPTVWWGGRVVGGWGQRGDGEVVYRLLEDVGAEAAAAVRGAAEGLQAWLGEARVTPAFRTPLERELTS